MLVSSALVVTIFLGAILRVDLSGLMLVLFLAAIGLLMAALWPSCATSSCRSPRCSLEVRQAREK